jgi:hypothetical protein
MFDTLWPPDELKLANEKNEKFDPTIEEMATLSVGTTASIQDESVTDTSDATDASEKASCGSCA